MVITLIYFVVGLYFINLSFNWISLPDTTIYNFTINMIVGAMLILGGFTFWKYNNTHSF